MTAQEISWISQGLAIADKNNLVLEYVVTLLNEVKKNPQVDLSGPNGGIETSLKLLGI